jgi:hypothetical protein
MHIFAMKFHPITLLLLPTVSERVEIESTTLLILLRSIALSSSVSICLLSCTRLEIREELLKIGLLLFLFRLLLP